MRCAAMAMVCNPEEQYRFTVMPEVVTGQPARSAICRAMLKPVAPSGLAQPMMTSSTEAGSSFARCMALLTTCPPSVAPWVRLNEPRQDLVSGVRAVDTMTASTTGLPLFRRRRVCESTACRRQSRQQLRRLPRCGIGVIVGGELAHAPHDLAKSHATRLEHGTATLRRESVTGQVHDVDVGGAQRDALFQDLRAFVDQRVQQTIHDLGVGNLARCNVQRLAFLVDDLVDHRIGDGVALARLVAIPSEPGLLAEAPQLADAIGDTHVPH